MTSLLPTHADPSLAPIVLVTPVRVVPTGLSGYVGDHDSPSGEILGRRVQARVEVTVRSPTTVGLGAAVSEATNAVVARSRTSLAQLGILKVGLGEVGPTVAPPTQGPPQPAKRDVAFDVLFEYLHLPTDTGGVIAEIPLDTDITQAGTPRLLRRGAFLSPDVMNAFEVVDDAAAVQAAPSDWQYDATEQAIRQLAATRGGPNTPTPNKPGTCLLLRAGPLLPPLRDFSLATEFRATTPGGIGVVFRFQDPDNFGFVLLDSAQSFRMIARKTAGTFAALDAGGLDTARGFETGQLHTLRVAAEGASIRVLLDGVNVLEGTDGNLAAAGRMGLLTRACDGAHFYDLTLLQL